MSKAVKPNKANIRKWVEALRSGEYKQARGVLCRVRGEQRTYCCLGVASEISGTTETHLGPPRGGWRTVWYDNTNSILPSNVSDWLGLYGPVPFVRLPNGGNARLSDLNDTGRSFAEIADLIEQEWLS